MSCVANCIHSTQKAFKNASTILTIGESKLRKCSTELNVRSILDEIPDNQSGTFFWMCLLVRTCESIGMSAYLTAMFSVVASEFSDGVTTAFVRTPTL